jgi:hypothetical protein
MNLSIVTKRQPKAEITAGDYFRGFFALPPLIVAIVVLIFGWGNLFLFAIKTDSLGAFLHNPDFMVGDLIMLPLAGLLVSVYYGRASERLNFSFINSNLWHKLVLLFAFILSSYNAIFSLYVWHSTHFDIIIVPHFFFYWFVVYELTNFFIKGAVYLLRYRSFLMLFLYISVLLAIVVHLTLPSVFGPKTFPGR